MPGLPTARKIPLLSVLDHLPRGVLPFLAPERFGKKYEMKQIVELQWPEYDVAIVNCPDCGSPREKYLSASD